MFPDGYELHVDTALIRQSDYEGVPVTIYPVTYHKMKVNVLLNSGLELVAVTLQDAPCSAEHNMVPWMMTRREAESLRDYLVTPAIDSVVERILTT